MMILDLKREVAMKKIVAGIILVCISISVFSSCQDNNYSYSETRDVSEYSPNYDVFPSDIENAEILDFGDAVYNYWSRSVDEFLVLKFTDKSSFENELERINGLKNKYDHLEKEDYLVDGYDCTFLMCSYSTGKEESIKKYIHAWSNETYYGIGWDLVMISDAEMTIVYNILSYDTRDFDKWKKRDAYISEYFGLDLETMARELDVD